MIIVVVVVNIFQFQIIKFIEFIELNDCDEKKSREGIQWFFFPGENDDDDIQYNNSFIYFYNWNWLVINKNQSINHIDKQNRHRFFSLWICQKFLFLFFCRFELLNVEKYTHTQHKLLKCNYHYHTQHISDYYTTDDHDSNLLPFFSCLLDCLLLHIWQQIVQNWIYHLICICIMDCIGWINHATFFYFLIFVLFSQTNKQHAQQQQQSNKQKKNFFSMFPISFIHQSINVWKPSPSSLSFHSFTITEKPSNDGNDDDEFLEL